MLTNIASATPHLPVDPNQVLLTLTDAAQRKQLRELHSDSTTDSTSGQESVTVTLAQQYLALGRAQADERYFGNAAALLQPWLAKQTVSEETQVLQANLLQHQHQFIAAEQLLDKVIANNAMQAQARLMRATVKFSQGQPEAAQADCHALARAADALISMVCLAELNSLSGRLKESYMLLSSLHERMTSRVQVPVLAWMLALLGDMAERHGELQSAEQWWRETLSVDADDLVTRLALTDLLINTHRASVALQLLENAPLADGVLLRRALAMKQLGEQSATPAIADWNERCARNQQLGISLHLREQAIGELYLFNNAQRALVIARQNWQTQREPADARIYAAAAHTARSRADLEAIVEWQRKTKLQDAQLNSALESKT